MPYCTNDPIVHAQWLTLGSASQLRGRTAQTPWHTRLLGESLALWLDRTGQPQCRLGQTPVLVMLQYGYLWVCTSGQPEKPLFTLAEFDQPGRRIVDCGGLGVATSGLRVVENFLDMGHFPYVHGGTLGQIPHTTVAPYQVHVEPQTDEVWATGCHFFQPQASASASGGIDAQYRYRVMHPLCAALYKSCPNRADAQDVIGLFIQPLDDEHVVAHCLLVYYEDQLSDAEMIGFQHMIFGQDKPILESQRPRRLPLDASAEAQMRCDLGAVAYRRWLGSRGMRFGVHGAATNGG